MNEVLDAIDEYLRGDLSREGLEALYYHARLQQETARRKQAECDAEHARALLADLIRQSIRDAKWARAWKRAAKMAQTRRLAEIERYQVAVEQEQLRALEYAANAGRAEQEIDDLRAEICRLQAQRATVPQPASSTTPTKTYPCPDCDFVALTTRGLGVHRSKGHRPARTVVLEPCPHCGITGLNGKPWASGHQRGGHMSRCPELQAHSPRVTQLGRDASEPDPWWRCVDCGRPADVIAPDISDPSRCIGCVKARKEAA